jgi:uncharacterized protein (DUF58 family)
MHLAERGYFLIVIAALLAVAGIWSDDLARSWDWMWVAALLLAGLAAEAWLSSKTRISSALKFPQRFLLGRRAEVALQLAHDGARGIRVAYAVDMPQAFAEDMRPRVLEVPMAGASDHWGVTPVRLGPGEFAPLRARVLGRFGLAWWSRKLHASAVFTVAPDTLGAAPRPVAGNVRGDAVRRASGLGSEVFQLREYVPGDPLSRIDWKASARAGSLIARDLTEDQHLEIALVIDAGRMSRVRAGALDRLALYANIAARFAQHAIRLDDRVGVVAYSDRVLASAAPGRGLLGVQRLRAALERMRADRAESRPMAAATGLQRMLPRRSLIVWLCDYSDPECADEVLRAVKLLGARHFVIVASVESTTLTALAEREPRDWHDPWIAVAADERRNDTAARTAHLARQGALVVRAPETRLEAAVLAAYESTRRRRRV